MSVKGFREMMSRADGIWRIPWVKDIVTNNGYRPTEKAIREACEFWCRQIRTVLEPLALCCRPTAEDEAMVLVPYRMQ